MKEGVEAWSVANRSGVGAEADMLQPAVKAQMNNVQMNFVLISLNGFKVALLARQNLCANTATIGTRYLFVDRVIFLKASHTLHFGSYKTEVQLRVFRRCALAEFSPMSLNGSRVDFGDFTDGNVKGCDMF